MDEKHLEMAEAFQNDQLQRAIKKATEAETTKGGMCLNCGEVLHPEKKFCDASCREDFELRAKVHRKTHAI